MKRLTYWLMVATLLSLVVPAPAQASSLSPIALNVVDAYYGDADGDGLNDDVVAIIDMDINVPGFFHVIQYEVYLVLPNGDISFYGAWFITWNPKLRITNYFYNQATEYGNYTIYAYAGFFGDLYPSGFDTVTFDPPGGDNADPPGWGMTVDPRTG